jgi:hypothetical protein
MAIPEDETEKQQPPLEAGEGEGSTSKEGSGDYRESDQTPLDS